MATCRAALAKGEDHELEYRALRATGDIVWLRDIVHVVPGAAGRAGQLRGLTVDLTELKRADEALRQSEDQLRQAQKMNALGELTGVSPTISTIFSPSSSGISTFWPSRRKVIRRRKSLFEMPSGPP